MNDSNFTPDDLETPARWYALVQRAASAGTLDALGAALAALPDTPLVAVRRAQLIARSRAYRDALALLDAHQDFPLARAQRALLLTGLGPAPAVLTVPLHWTVQGLWDVEAAYRLDHARGQEFLAQGRQAEARDAFTSAEAVARSLGLQQVSLAVGLQLVGLDMDALLLERALGGYRRVAEGAVQVGSQILLARAQEGAFYCLLLLGRDVAELADTPPAAHGPLWRALSARLAGDLSAPLPAEVDACHLGLVELADAWRDAWLALRAAQAGDARAAARIWDRCDRTIANRDEFHRAVHLAARALTRLAAGDGLGAQADVLAMPDGGPITCALKGVCALQVLAAGVRVPDARAYPMGLATQHLSHAVERLGPEACARLLERYGALVPAVVGVLARSASATPELGEWLASDAVIRVDRGGVAWRAGQRLRDWPRRVVALLDDVLTGVRLPDTDDRTMRRYRQVVRDASRPVVFDYQVDRAVDRGLRGMPEFERLSWQEQ